MSDGEAPPPDGVEPRHRGGVDRSRAAAPSDAGAPELVAGVVARAHGLDGSFHVAGARPALLTLGAIVAVGGTRREIVRRAGTDERPIVRLADVETRDAAEALRGEQLRAPRSAAAPLGDGEFWAEDIEGCTVRDGAAEVGVVRRLLGYPSCELLEVSRSAASDLLVPLVRDAVRSIDLEHRVIDVDLAFLGGADA